jgi:hypothetical protein
MLGLRMRRSYTAAKRLSNLARLGIPLVVVGLALAPSASAVTGAQIVSTVNAERHANGLPPVREDPALSAGCADYDNYRRLNGGIQDGFTPGPEDPSMPGYTTAGARAARNSLLNAGDRPADNWATGDDRRASRRTTGTQGASEQETDREVLLAAALDRNRGRAARG